MKRYGLKTAVVALTTAFILFSCTEKEEKKQPLDNPESAAVEVRIAQEEHIYDDITHTYSNSTLSELLKSDTATTTTITTWQWAGDTLKSTTSIENGIVKETTTYTYSDSQVRIEKNTHGGEYSLIVFHGKQLTAFETYSGDEKIWETVFGYGDGQLPNHATVNNYAAGTKTSTTEYTLTFDEAENLTDIEYKSYGYTFHKTYTYGTANNPCRLTGTGLNYLNLSKNEVLTEKTETIDGGDPSTERKDFVYTYDSKGRQTTLTTYNSSIVGKYKNEYIHTYRYTYLTEKQVNE